MKLKRNILVHEMSSHLSEGRRIWNDIAQNVNVMVSSVVTLNDNDDTAIRINKIALKYSCRVIVSPSETI